MTAPDFPYTMDYAAGSSEVRNLSMGGNSIQPGSFTEFDGLAMSPFPGNFNSTTSWLFLNQKIDIAFMQEVEEMSRVANIVVPIVIVAILVLGLIGNALVVYVTIVTNRASKHPIHSLFVLNLAAADVLYLLVCAPYSIIANSMSAWRFGAVLCPIIPFLSTCSMAASIYTICALAWMRFMALVMPFRFRRSRISTRRAGYFVILAIWIASLILSIPNLVHYGLKEMHEPGGEISVECRWTGERALQAFALVKLLVTYILPLILVSVFYAVIGREVLCYMMRNSARSSNQYNSGKGKKSDEQKECAKSTMVVMSLILAFLICWFPHLLTTVFKVAGVNAGLKHAKSRFILDTFGLCLSYAHACVNPFIYTFASPIFRRGLRTSLRENLSTCRRRRTGWSVNGANQKNRSGSPRNLHNREPQNASSARHDIAQQNPILATNATESLTPKTERIPMTTSLEHPTLHTSLGYTSPVLSNEMRRLKTPTIIIDESDQEELGQEMTKLVDEPGTQENDISPDEATPVTKNGSAEVVDPGGSSATTSENELQNGRKM